MTVMTIPVLPCASIPQTLAFYQALGFEVTHEQAAPNPYAATCRDGVNLHFMGLKGFDPARGYSTCLAIVPEVEALHQTFADGLRRTYGKVPVAGLPRISRMRKGQSRFTLVDVAGNSVIFIRRDAPDDYDEAAAGPATHTRLDKALRAAARLRDFKNDDAAAARLLDAALRRDDSGSPFERARVLAARVEIGVAMADDARAKGARAELDALLPTLTDDERARLRDAIEAIAAVERSRS